MKKIIDLLNNKKVSDYKIVRLNTLSYELYFIHDVLETVRTTDSTDTNVTVYVDHNGFRGDSTFSLYKTDSVTTIEEKIDNAIEMAKLINNQKFSLPSNQNKEYTIESNLARDPKDLAYDIYKVLAKCVAKSKAQLNATEIFIKKFIKEITNSRNLTKKQTSYQVFIETIPTFEKKKKTDSVELYFETMFNNFDEEDLEKKITNALNDVIIRSKAKKPDFAIDCDVILRPLELTSLFESITSELNASGVYMNNNLYKIGDNIQSNPLFDKLNITLAGQALGSAFSNNFDNDGVELKSKKLIEDSKVISYYGNNKFSKYISIKPTGNLEIIKVSKGSYSEKDLRSGDYLECVSFSGIQVDVANDYIGGEVRSAVLHTNNKKLPITGISISAKLSDVLNTIKLSKKLVVDKWYVGPTLARFSNFKIF